jgi:type IV pilus secretin PilQ/predicted competence protein
MRKQMLGTIIALLAIVLVAGAQTPGTEPTAAHAALQKVSVIQGDGGVSIEMTAKGAVMPKVETLSSPARIVVDLPNTAVATSINRIHVGNNGVNGVRIGTDARATTRVVVDLDRLCKYELVPGPGDKLTLKLQSAAPPAQTVSSPAKPVAPVTTATLVVPAEQKAEPSKTTANNFVVVEPSYAPKKDAAPMEPPARAVESASKFVERPEGNLLPVASAAMQGADQSSSTPAASHAIQPAVNLAAEQKTHPQATSGPKYTGEPISVNLKDVDLKDFFRLIHEISGLNVVLDPDVKGNLTIVLDDVPWDQALDIVLKNNTLSRQLDGNVLRIATVDTLRKEAEARRAAQEAEALAVDKVNVTRFLSYAHSRDVATTIKKFLSQRGDVVADERTNAVIISDIPAVIPAVDRLIAQLDRKTQEVEIEARVVAATRSFARDIGTQLGVGWGNNASSVRGGQGGTVPATVAGTTTNVPLFSNLAATGATSGLAIANISHNVQLDAILTMAESRGLLKILSRPRVVTQNNIMAVVKQGVRIPVVTQSQLNGPATTTYIDAFLRLTVTPQITVENTIFLNVDVENTTPDFGHQVGGNPTLITQQATTQVLVTDGGTVVIGGVIQTNNSVAVSQVPLLGSIPWLGELFRRQAVSSSNQELIFFITPRVVET